MRSARLWAPSTAETTSTAPSETWSAHSASLMKAAKPGVSRALKVRPPSSKVSGWMVSVKLRFFSSGSASRREVEPSGLARLASAARRKASTRAVFPAPSAPRMENVRAMRGAISSPGPPAWGAGFEGTARGRSITRIGGAPAALSSALQLGELLLPELERAALVPGPPLLLEGAQLHAPDLPRDGLRQVRELDAAYPLVRGEAPPDELEDVARQLPGGLRPGLEDEEGLGHVALHRVGARDHRRLGHRPVLDEGALQLEGADAVVGALEDVVGPADVGDVAVRVPHRDVAGVVVAVAHHELVQRRVVLVAGHEPGRAGREVEGDLPLVGQVPLPVEERDPVPGHGAPHRARLDHLARGVAHLRGGLGLAVPVADDRAPALPHLLDDLGVERL